MTFCFISFICTYPLFGVPVGVFTVPLPGGGDDFFEVGPFGLPAEFGSGFGGIADKRRRVAGPARRFDDLEVFPRHLFYRINDLPNRIALSYPRL